MNNLKILFLVCTILSGAMSSFAQYNKVSVAQKPQSMEVLQVDNRESSTMVILKYTRQAC